jgi:ribosome-binding factor A
MSRPRRPATASTHRYPRTARLNESLREVIAEDLVRIDDDRLALVTITAIDVDAEMNRAVVFFDSLAGEDGDEEILAAFAILQFKPDQTIRAAERIERILHDTNTMPERPVDPNAPVESVEPAADLDGDLDGTD